MFGLTAWMAEEPRALLDISYWDCSQSYQGRVRFFTVNVAK